MPVSGSLGEEETDAEGWQARSDEQQALRERLHSEDAKERYDAMIALGCCSPRLAFALLHR